MDTRTYIRGGTVAFAMAALLGAAPAGAQLNDTAVDCRDAVAKNEGKLLKTAHKVIGGCHKARDKDVALVGTDCNDLTAADLAKGKFAKSRTKAIDAIVSACGTGAPGDGIDLLTAANDDGSGKEWYISCPVDPCNGITDNVINTGAELGACLACVAENAAEVAGDETLGLPNPANLSAEEIKCHGAIAKGYAKYFNTAYKTETACQSDADGAADSDADNEIAACSTADPKLKVAGSLTKAAEGLDKACVGATISDLDGCAADLPTLKTCTAASWAAAEADAYTNTYEMESTACPTAVRTTILGGCSTHDTGTEAGCSSGFASGTVLNVGWKGLAHGVDVTDSYTIAVDVTCTGDTKGACGTCTSTGISYDNPQYADFTRCLDDPWTKCDEPFANDTVCNNGIGGACRYFLGPPLAVSAGGTPTCTLNVVNSDIVGGTGDPDLGTADFMVDLRSVVHLGIGQERPCPYCRNDPATQDGNVAGGVCEGGTSDGDACTDDDGCPSGDCVGNFGECFGGPRNGQPCDVQGFDLSFSNPDQPDDSPDSGPSLDCPPTSGANISGGGLEISLPLTTGASMKDAEDPCESPNASLDCFCGVCSGAQTTSCNNDLECSSQGFGSCVAGGSFPGVPRKPNNCTDTICYPVNSDRGICSSDIAMTPDIDTYCSGLLFANGKGVISCGTDADCDVYITGSLDEDTWVCPNDDCGTCTEASYRSCFNDPLTITGTPDPVNPILAGSFCLPPSSNGSVNNATGSPGPGTVQTDTLVELRY